MAQNQNFALLKIMVESNDKEMYELCTKLREKENIPHNSGRIPHALYGKVEQRVNYVVKSCEKDIKENYEDFLDYLLKRAKGTLSKLFSTALYTSLRNAESEKEGEENDI